MLIMESQGELHVTGNKLIKEATKRRRDSMNRKLKL